MSDINAFIGLDVHKDSIAVAVAEGTRDGEIRLLGNIQNTNAAIDRLVRRLCNQHGRIEFVHEAGPCGYGLHRHLQGLGQESRICAPSRIPRRAGDRIKNDARDALILARLLRAGELDFIWVPDEVHEAVRDLVRARQAASFDVRKARQRIQSFLLKYARRYGKKPWGAQHRTWLANQSFEHSAQQIAFENYLRAEHQSVLRRAELDQQLREIMPSWSLAPIVEALQALRGVAFVIAVCLVSEIGDFTRFKMARHLMAFVGLVPGEQSSGNTVRPRGITKAGNKIVRSHLLEAAWCYRLHAKIGARLVRRDSSLPEIAKEIAWKAQVRLCGRHRRLTARGKKSQLVTTAVARELVGFIWAIGREFHVPTLSPAGA